MESRIFKYSLPREFQTKIELPKDRKILSFQKQYNGLCIWVQHNLRDSNVTELVEFEIVGTGNVFEFSQNHKFIGTVQDGPFVWHLFEVTHSS